MSSMRSVKDTLYGQVGRLAKSMANPKRLELVELLCQSPKSVEMLAEQAGISVKLASAHLKELRLAHVVDTEKHGRQVIYRISCEEVAGLLVGMRKLATGRLFELRDSLKELDADGYVWSEVDAQVLLRKAKRGDITLIDVRPQPEFDRRHLPHSRSIPVKDLAKRLQELPKGKPVIAYCRGPFCSMSADAVKLLRAKGFTAYLWQEGAADWMAGELKDGITVGS